MPDEKKASLDEKLDTIISSLTARNATTQEQKNRGTPWGWIAAGVSALLALIGVGVALYFHSKRSKELAEAKTKLEQQKVDAESERHHAEQIKNHSIRQAHLAKAVIRESKIAKQENDLAELEAAHEARRAALKGLSAWGDINAK